MKPLVVAIVLPSLNEEVSLQATCKSLGFHKTAEPLPNTFLFIVDNGSTDGTLEVAKAIQRDAPRGTVIIGQEKERGYIPPRHTGNLLVKVFADGNDLDQSEILVLQVDADTLYEEGYIERMRSASQHLGCNYLLEGLAEFSPGFRDSFPEYVDLCTEVDTRVLSAIGLPETNDLLCTDAVCGYRLSDYFTWGGHLREYRGEGDEIHAETTRLYMRSLTYGGRKLIVEEALGYPSERKIISSPAEDFATAGFPRDTTWKALWKQQYHGSIRLEDFREYLNHPTILHAIQLRERHMVALFGILPLHVARALGVNLTLSAGAALHEIVGTLPHRHSDSLYLCPGAFLTDVLNLADLQGSVPIDAILGGQDQT